jgi:hypothetical protein
MSRIVQAEELINVWDEHGYTPSTDYYLYPSVCMACALGALYMHEFGVPSREPGVGRTYDELEESGYPLQFLAGLDSGFSHGLRAFSKDDPANPQYFNEGFQVGVTLRDKVFNGAEVDENSLSSA